MLLEFCSRYINLTKIKISKGWSITEEKMSWKHKDTESIINIIINCLAKHQKVNKEEVCGAITETLFTPQSTDGYISKNEAKSPNERFFQRWCM